MRSILSTILLAGAGIFFSAAVNAASEPNPTAFPFPLRAWHDPRDHSVPLIDHYVEIDTSGAAIINKTASYPGFKSYISPTPELGTLHTSTGESGYLLPVSYPDMPPNPCHYQLMYNKDIPTIPGVLYKTFRTFGRSCGGNCGGATLDYYYRGIEVNGEWYIIPVEWPSGSNRMIWALRWIAAQDIPIQDYPDKAIPVYLWKS